MERQEQEINPPWNRLYHFLTRRTPPEMHEFFLTVPLHGHENVYRVTLGKWMDATKRKSFRPHKDSLEARTKTGSVGYMDLEIRERKVREGEVEISVPRVIIAYLAVEPRYQGRGYARLLVQRAEELAQQWGAEAIIGEGIVHEARAHIHRGMGYEVNEEGTLAVKVLKES